MPSIRTGLALASLAWLANANTPVVLTRVDCTTQVTTSYLPGPTFIPANPPVEGSGGQYWCPVYGNLSSENSDSLGTPCTEGFKDPVSFTLFWNSLKNPKYTAQQKPGPPQPIEMFTDWEFETYLSVKDITEAGLTVAIDGKELGNTSILDKSGHGLHGSWRIPAGEHTIRISWKNLSDKDDLVKSLDSVPGQFQFDRVVSCDQTSGGNGNTGNADEEEEEDEDGEEEEDNENAGTTSTGKTWKRIADSNKIGKLGKTIHRGVKPGSPAACIELCAQSEDRGCKWAAWTPADGGCFTYSSAISEPYVTLVGSDLLVFT